MGTNGLKDIKADITDIPLNPGLITEFLVLVSTEVESLNSAEQLMGFDLGSFRLDCKALTRYATLPNSVDNSIAYKKRYKYFGPKFHNFGSNSVTIFQAGTFQITFGHVLIFWLTE